MSDEPTDQKELKPCPFCGEHCSWDRDAHQQECGGKPLMYVNCGRCGAEGPGRWVEADAITGWNTRAALKASGCEDLQTLLDDQSQATGDAQEGWQAAEATIEKLSAALEELHGDCQAHGILTKEEDERLAAIISEAKARGE